jgi:seryl-tRNA synthetase
MLDPQLLRSDIDSVARRLAARSFTLDVAGFQSIEEERKAVQVRTQELQAARNQFAKRIGQAKAKGENVAELMAESGRANAELVDLEKRLEVIQQRLQDLSLGVPNLPHESVPAGKSSEDNVEVRKIGAPRAFAFPPRDHVDVGEGLKMLDFDTATKIAGARFALRKGPLAHLHRAIAQFMLDVHTQEHGYTEVYAP